MATWPAGLPQTPDTQGQVEKPADLLLRTQMDAGPAKVRRRYTAGVRPFNCTFFMTKAQVATLETFYVTTLTGGADAFDWAHPRTGVTESWRFVAPPEYRPRGAGLYYDVVCALEQLP